MAHWTRLMLRDSTVNLRVFLSVDVCRRKWKSLRDTYMRERRKVTETRSGAAAGTAKKWKYFVVLSFLDPFVSPHETNSNMELGVEGDGTAELSIGSVEDEGETAGPSGIAIGGLLTNEHAHIYSMENSFCIKWYLTCIDVSVQIFFHNLH